MMLQNKIYYYRVITSLIGVIFLLGLFIFTNPPKTETIEIIKEVEIPKEIITEVEKEVIVEVEKEVIVEIEPTYAYSISSVEREMLARLVYLEANIESIESQMAVVSVVINRWQDGRWGNTIADVIYSPKQFTPAPLISQTTPTEINYAAVDAVLKDGCTLPSYIMYFRADYHFNWTGYKPHAKIDQTCFGYFEKDKK
jgi:hypothetical protein